MIRFFLRHGDRYMPWQTKTFQSSTPVEWRNCVRACVRARVRGYARACVCVCARAHVQVCLRMSLCCVHVCMYVCVSVCGRVYLSVCARVRMRARSLVLAHIQITVPFWTPWQANRLSCIIQTHSKTRQYWVNTARLSSGLTCVGFTHSTFLSFEVI